MRSVAICRASFVELRHTRDHSGRGNRVAPGSYSCEIWRFLGSGSSADLSRNADRGNGPTQKHLDAWQAA
jgi:hypothetical protein